MKDTGDQAPGIKVSVVIPTYNRANYLPQAIDSVLAQTLTGVELIVVDDGSTDGTTALMRTPPPNVRYVRTNHGGLAHARNTGMRLARGEYIAFLDADDVYYPYKLEAQARLLDMHPETQMVYTELSSFDDGGDGDRFHLRTYHSAYRDPELTYERIFETSVDLASAGFLPFSLLESCPDVAGRRAYFGNIFDSYLRNVIVFHNSMMIRRVILDEVGYHDEALAFFLELDLILRICRRHRVAFMDVPTYKLRYHPGQISSTAGAEGGRVAIQKQHCLLRAVRRHIRMDQDYYARYRTELDGHLARLHRAVAVPLLAYGQGPSRARSSYPRRARRFLARCRELGRREPLLWCLTFMPSAIRRIVFAARGRTQSLRRIATGRGRFSADKSARLRVRKPVAAPPTTS